MLGEALLARSQGWQRHDSMYVLLPFVMYFLFALLLRARGRVRLPLGSFSLLVYILHPAVIIAVRGAAMVLGLWDILVENSLGHYAAVCLGSAAASAVILLVWARIGPRSVSPTAAPGLRSASTRSRTTQSAFRISRRRAASSWRS